MNDYSLHRGAKHLCRYFLQAFITEEILKRQVKIALKLMLSKELQCLRKVNMLNSKNLKEK